MMHIRCGLIRQHDIAELPGGLLMFDRVQPHCLGYTAREWMPKPCHVGGGFAAVDSTTVSVVVTEHNAQRLESANADLHMIPRLHHLPSIPKTLSTAEWHVQSDAKL